MFRDLIGFANKLWCRMPLLTEYTRERVLDLYSKGLISRKGRITKKGRKALGG